MTLYLPSRHPVLRTLSSMGVDVRDPSENPDPNGTLKIGVINLMPKPEDPIRDFSWAFAKAGMNVEIVDISRNPLEHQINIDDIQNLNLDGIIVSGFGREEFDFKELRFWNRLTDALNYAEAQNIPVLGSCWGAQALLYHHYDVIKKYHEKKISGIFTQSNLAPNHALMKGVDREFTMPVSRYGRCEDENIEKAGLDILSTGSDTGISIATDGRITCVTGHPEYAGDEIAREYFRDLEKEVPNTCLPVNTFIEDDPTQKALPSSWADMAENFFKNWLESVAEHKSTHTSPAEKAEPNSAATPAVVVPI